MNKQYKKEVVHQICFHLLPDDVKENIFHAAFSAGIAWENAESLEDIDEAMGDLMRAMNPAYQTEYGLKVERLIEVQDAA